MTAPSRVLVFVSYGLGLAPFALAQQAPPAVSSGTLVAQFQANTATLSTGPAGEVQSWTAQNDPAISLVSSGAPDQISYDATGMNCVGTVQFTDHAGGDQWLEGDLPAGVDLGDTTIFWLGYYGSDPAVHGRYVYSIGRAGSDGSQLTHQSDDMNNGYIIEIYNGGTTYNGTGITQRENRWQVWRTEYYANPVVISHRAFVNGVDLIVNGDLTGYDVNPDPNTVYLGGWQGAGYNMVGAVSELLIYEGVLSAPDASAIEAYLAARVPSTIGTSYCGPANMNSTGRAASITACGSLDASLNSLSLTAIDLPPAQFGYFLASLTEGSFMPPGSSGTLCLSGNIGRFNGAPLIVRGPVGRIDVDLTAVPINPTSPVQPGETWRFQCWYRDVGTSNFTDGVRLLFQ